MTEVTYHMHTLMRIIAGEYGKTISSKLSHTNMRENTGLRNFENEGNLQN